MEIRVLRYFLAVAKEGTITGASQFLHVTQPTLSRQLMDLEIELGQKLFIRGSHNITLTNEGMILRKRAQEIIDMVEKTETDFRNIKDEISGQIFIGGGEFASIKYVAEVIREIQEEYPNIKYNFFSGNVDDVTEKLDKGLIDFGILLQPTDISKYAYLSLPSKECWGVIMRKDSKLAQKTEILMDDLLDVPVILPRRIENSANTQQSDIQWFGSKLEKLNVIANYNLIYNAEILVKEGIGYAIGLDRLIDEANSDLCFRPFSPSLTSGVDIIWKKYQVFTPAAKIFLTKMMKKFGE